ncbi:MAG: hypothetical protein CMP91_10120 [Gammaproteobacteria bacterium]|mgnify:FL=1|nr:hypothetical protein [Gammaproteobacteria bacterium]|tara:strand:- start:2070 stop:2339 length:270 start_codon:yes stop_codon:yes gene_type:complete
MSFRTFSVGRASDADIQINGQSVSRKHLELTRTDDGKYYLIDANSTAGTRIRKGESWELMKQGFVNESDILLLGKEEVQVRQLVHSIKH